MFDRTHHTSDANLGSFLVARFKFNRYRNTHIFDYFRVSFDKLLFQGLTQISTYCNFFLLKYAGSYMFFSLDIDILCLLLVSSSVFLEDYYFINHFKESILSLLIFLYFSDFCSLSLFFCLH